MSEIKKHELMIGVDPGLSGAIAFLRTTDRKLHVYDMPTYTKLNSRKEIEIGTLVALIKPFIHSYSRPVAIIEDVSAMTYVDRFGQKRGQGAAASFAFGKSFGIILAVLETLGVNYMTVKPAVWKAQMNLSSDKELSRKLALKIYPRNEKDFALKKHDGRAEAALLCEFGVKGLL